VEQAEQLWGRQDCGLQNLHRWQVRGRLVLGPEHFHLGQGRALPRVQLPGAGHLQQREVFEFGVGAAARHLAWHHGARLPRARQRQWTHKGRLG